MPPDDFVAPLFIKEGPKMAVDTNETPFFYNNNGSPAYSRTLPSWVTQIEPAATDPSVAIGREYVVSEVGGGRPMGSGIASELKFVGDDIGYQPFWVTRSIAAAFGVTLVEKSQGLRMSSPVNPLSQVDYEYGVFAGHQSPYEGTGYRLITKIITDLEHHDFPHVFASVDPNHPLVISVGRYWPRLGKIRLADLWVPQGSALYIPPKPALLGRECIDLHGNRNSARACWSDSLGKDSVATKTLLQDPGEHFHWYWNATPTTHANSPPKV